MRVTIPTTIQEAQASLSGIGALLTAKQWERAAIVYAFTEPSPGGNPVRNLTGSRLSIAAFASLGVTGLGSRPSVTAYRKAWADAMEAGAAQEARPGEPVDLPDLPWKDFYGEPTEEVQDRVARQVMRDPVRVQSIVRADPGIRATVTQAVVREAPEEVQRAVVEDLQARSPEPSARRWTPPAPAPGPDYGFLLRRLLGDLVTIQAGIQSGRFDPTPDERSILGLLPSLLTEPEPSIHDQIAAFLAAGQEA